MLDYYIIKKIIEEKIRKENEERPCLYIEDTIEDVQKTDKEEEKEERVIVIEL